MEYTRLGETDLEVSRIGLGTWQLGGEWGAVDEDEAEAAVRRALDLGINLFDTAQAYGFGESEQRLARALREEIRSDREAVVLATKGGLRPEGGGVVRDAGAEWLREGLEASLAHLGTDHVDVYQVHWPDPDTPAEETAGILQQFVDEGKVRYVGVSNYSARQMHELERHIKIDTLQPPYHIFRREIEKHVLPYCEAHGIGTMAYGPLAHGLLGGRYEEDTTFDADDWRSRSSAFSGEVFANNLEVVARLEKFAFDRGLTVAQVAIGWVLAHPGIDVALVGARRPDQIDGVAEAGDLFLDPEELEEIADLIEDAIEIGGATPEGVD